MSEFRIEIPIDVTTNANIGELQQLENALNRIYSSFQKDRAAAQGVFDAAASGAGRAAQAIGQVDTAADRAAQSFEEVGEAANTAGSEGQAAAQEAGQAAEQLGDSVGEAADAYDEVGDAAQQAGHESGSAFTQASNNVDQFTQRVEKSERTLRDAFKEKIQLILEALDRASPALKNIANTVKGLTAKAWHVAVKMTDMVTAPFRKIKDLITSPIVMTLSMAGISLGAGSFINTFKDFTAGMSTVKALSGATEEEFERLTAKAEELGATTKFTATEASEGMQYLAMAGWETNEIIDAMPGLLQLAAAGQTDLGTAADIVSDVMTAMGMSAEEATRAADVFARTATSTNTTVSMMGETLKYAAPAAKAFGMQIEDVATLTGMMANAGIKGSSAGTALRTALLRMASPTSDAAKAMQKLGVSFDDGHGNMKDMRTILSELSVAFKQLGNQERLAAADDLFGKNASTAWLAVLDQGIDTYDELSEAIYNSKGAAEEMANVQLDNLQGDLTLLQSAVDGMKISLMKELNPYLRSAVQWVTAKIPEITDKLQGMLTTGLKKAKELKDFIGGVFDSSDFQNADGFAGKFFVAWDKIIAEPFQKWWDGGGQKTILDAVGKMGKGLGDLYHGIISGIFAALKGEDIDFEGLNITGLAKAGAEAAKEFVTAFMEAFDIKGLFGEMPGLLKTGVLGYLGISAGGTALSLAKDISMVRIAFKGITTAAPAAASSLGAVGTSAASAASSAGSAASVLGLLKTGLAAIPVWGWVAAAALTAVAIGVTAYSSAQKQHEQDLLNTGKAAAQMAKDYEDSVQTISAATESVQAIKQIQLTIEEDRGGNQQVIDEFNSEVQEIQNRIVWLTAKIAQNSLTPEEAAEYQRQLEVVEGQIAEVEAKLKDGTLTPEEAAEYQRQLEVLKGQKAELEAALASNTLTKSDIEKYQSELDALHGNVVELVASLNDEGYDSAQVAIIQEQVNAIEEGEKTVTLIIADKTELTPDQISEYVSRLSELMALKTTYELQIEGHGLTVEEVDAYRSKLEDIQARLSEVTVKINKGQGTMSDDDWNTLLSEAASLQAQAADIQILLQGSTMNDQEIADVKEKLGEVRGEAAGILLNIGYSPDSEITQEDLNNITGIMTNVGEIRAELNIGLADGSMGVKELEDLNKQLNEAYGNLVEMSGGYFTEEDVARGRITQERYDSWLANQESTARLQRAEFKAQVEADRENIPELVEKRATAQANAEGVAATAGGTTADFDFMQGLEGRRKDLLSGYLEGSVTDEQLFEGGQQIIQEARDHQWTEMPPANFMAFTPDQLFGEYTGGLFGTGLFGHWEANAQLDPFADALSELQKQTGRQDNTTDAYTAKADEANAALNQQYQNEVRVVETEAFAGFGAADTKSTATIQELAASYDTLDAAGQQMFANAIAGLEQLNSTTDYISEAEKINTGELVQQATESVTVSANVEVLGDVQSKLTEISTTYSTLNDETAKADFNAEKIEAVNAALDALGLEKINDLSELQSKLQEISAIDPSGLSFEAAAASLSALGGDATATKQKLDQALASLKALDGQSATTTLTNNVYNNTYNTTTTKAAQSANGGIFDGAMLSWVAEDGPEAIIPLGAKRRDRGIDLWLQAGEMLGVAEFADGGIMEPYGNALEALPESAFSEDDSPAPAPAPVGGGNNGGGGGNTFTISVEANPTFQIEGGSSADDILDKLKEKQRELAELFGGAIADQLEDIVSNMV